MGVNERTVRTAGARRLEMISSTGHGKKVETALVVRLNGWISSGDDIVFLEEL